MPELDHATLAALELDHGRLLIEAGAGTGKTYLLASIHLKLVLAGHPPRAIAAVTFTNAATEELRGRLRARLREALRGLAGDGAARAEAWWPLVEAACGRDGADAVLRRVREALAAMDEAPFHTIHGLCLHILRRHPGAADVEPVLDPDADDRIRQAAEDFWRRHVACDPVAWEALAGRGIHTPDDLARIVRGAAGRQPMPWPEPPEEVDPERVARLQTALRQTVDAELDALVLGLMDRAAAFRKDFYPKDTTPEDAFQEMLDAARSWCEGGGRFPPRLTCERLLSGLRKRGAADVAEWLAGFRLPDLADEWNGLLQKLAHHRLHQALTALPEAAARLRREAGTLSPDDLLRLVFEALEGEAGRRLAARIAAEVRWLLVDEFQDTDALQYGILKKLEAAGTRLILIGDPKQAIYAFRGADVHTYLEARDETPPPRRFLLTRNHRSRPAVCQAVNRLYRHDHPFAWPGLEHPPAVPARAEDAHPGLVLPAKLDPAPGAGLTLWPLLPAGEARKPNKEEARLLAAASAARHIAALLAAARAGEARLGDRALEARDIAVLVREHEEAAAMREALARLGIPSAHTSRESVFGTEAARGLLAWIEAVAEPGTPARLRAALAEPLTGLDLAGLRQALDEDWEAWLERADELHGLWRRHGVLAGVLRLLETLEPGRIARREDGERLLTDLLHLAELLQRESGRHREPAALARWLRAQVEDPPTGEDHVLRLESERDAVRILTIHKAKGLQFPIVHLPFLWNTSPVERRHAPYAFHHEGRWRIAFDGDDDAALVLADRERLSENLRMLYVALTRAETKLYAWAWPVGQAAGRGPLDWILHPERHAPVVAGEEIFQAGDWRKDALEATLADWRARLGALAGDGIAVADNPPEAETAPAPRPRHAALRRAPLPPPADDPWRITSYSGIVRGEHRTVDHDAGEDDPPASSGGVGREHFPPGAATGNFLHRLLEEIDYRNPDWEGLRPRVEQLRLRYGLPAPDGWWDALVRWMEAVLAAPLPEGGALRELAPGDRLHEAVFHFRVRDARGHALNALLEAHGIEPFDRWAPDGRLAGLLTGAIDLVYRRDGRYYLADFKSNLLPDYGPARLWQAMRERRYDLQYLLYALALHRHLRLRLPGYDYERHFGGVRYLFLRGITPAHPGRGVLATQPPPDLIEGLDALLDGGLR